MPPRVTACIAERIFYTNPASHVINAQAPGIGCLASLDDLLILNNLGRNIEFCRPAASGLISMYRFARSVFPSGTEESEFDLDFHSFIHNAGNKLLFALNHDGRLLAFRTASLSDDSRRNDSAQQKTLQEQAPSLEIEPDFEVKWLGDVESTILVGDHLVSSSPTGYHATDPAQEGLFVSPALHSHSLESLSANEKLEPRIFFAQLGYVTALKFDSELKKLAFATGQELILTKPRWTGDGGLEFEEILWSCQMDFQITWIALIDRNTLMCAGHDVAGKESVDWSNLGGGGFALVDLPTGQRRAFYNFDRSLAWGNGGHPLALSRDHSCLIGIDRQANLFAWKLGNSASDQLYQSHGEPDSLGIAHLIRHYDRLYCGFNRDGYRLRVYDLP
jgi:hypothetical protein